LGVAVAPGGSARAGRDDLTMRRAAARELFGDFTAVTLGVQALLLLAALAGPFVAGTAGIIALALYHLQPLVVFGGTSMLPRDLFVNALVRAPLDLARIAQMGWAESSPAPVEGSVQAEVAQKRARYQELVSQGTAGFFEPRREDCPVCGSRTLEVKLSTIDVFQQKPGRFTIERCQGCGHLFQNPRLSLAGLDFYYGDFYDGLGEAGLEAVFAHGPDEYLSRARSVEGLVTPKSWLDVGTGHGHFGLVARSVWPGARMDGLDLSESIEEAERRGWVDKGIRGLFPEIAPRLAAEGQRWDVVSMSHYLEHTRDQRAEIAAAGKVLADGGVLLIEVPDPDSKIQHLLGRFWTPWFQPQHQHFVSVKNVERLLREEGFEPVRWLRGEAHRPVDFALSVVLFLKYLLPWVDTPWRARPQGRLVRLATTLAWTLCVPLVLIGAVLDGIFNPVFKRAGWSNAYRVVARRAVLPSAAKGATDGQKQAPLSMEDGSSTRGSP
jgi:SAM-dependent methyltransferase